MSFTITYRRFITVRVREQATDRPIASLQFTPTHECQGNLDKYMLLFRHRDNGFDLYYKTYPEASETLPAPIGERTRFSFSVRIREAAFFSVYEPGTSAPRQFYLDNLTSGGNISNAAAGNLTHSGKFSADDGAVIKGQTFTQRTEMPDTNPPAEWRIKELFPPHDTLQTIPITNPDSLDFVYVKINDPIMHDAEYLEASGPYRLETDRPDPPEATIYLSDYLHRSGAHGVLDIYWDSLQNTVPADTGKTYQIIFKRL